MKYDAEWEDVWGGEGLHLIICEGLEHVANIFVLLLTSDVSKGDAVHCQTALYDAAIAVVEDLLAIVRHKTHLVRTCTHHTHTTSPHQHLYS